MKKKVLAWLIFLLVILIPFGINILVSLHIPERWNYPIVGTAVDWLHFWASYLGATASFIVIVYTGMSLRQNRHQLEEIKRQWHEERRPRLTFSIVDIDGLLMIKIMNVGKETAYNIRLNFPVDFIDSLIVQSIRDMYNKLNNQSFVLQPNMSKFFYLSPDWSDDGVHNFTKTNETVTSDQFHKWLDENRKRVIVVSGAYCDKYDINENLVIDDFMLGMVVYDDMISIANHIRKGLVGSSEDYAPIRKSLDSIARDLKKKS